MGEIRIFHQISSNLDATHWIKYLGAPCDTTISGRTMVVNWAISCAQRDVLQSSLPFCYKKPTQTRKRSWRFRYIYMYTKYPLESIRYIRYLVIAQLDGWKWFYQTNNFTGGTTEFPMTGSEFRCPRLCQLDDLHRHFLCTMKIWGNWGSTFGY